MPALPALVACRPVSIGRAEVPSHIEIPDPHSSSRLARCERCRRPVWVGPQQSGLMAEHPEMNYEIACWICAIAEAQARRSFGLGGVDVRQAGDFRSDRG